ncbi:MAG: diguanylate cyclase [Acidaminococcaceae bacterium]
MRHQKNIVRLFLLLALSVLVVGTIWDFSRQLQRTLTNETYQTLADVSIDYNKAFAERIASDVRTLKILAVSLESLENVDQDDIVPILKKAVAHGGFTKVVVANAQGLSCSNEGRFVDVTHRDYFKQAMLGRTTVSNPLADAVNGEKVIIISVPLLKNDTTIGALFGIYPLATASFELLDFTYYSEGYGFIVAPNGNIVLAAEHTERLSNEQNLFSFFAKTELQNVSLAEIQTAINQGESKSFAFTYNGKKRFVSFMPAGVNDWYTFSIASDSLMRLQEAKTRQIVLELVTKLALIGLFLVLWLIWWNRRHNKAIVAASQQYQSLLSHINGGMIVAIHSRVAEGTIVTYASPGFTAMTGYTLEDIKTLYQGCYLNIILEEDRKQVFAIYLEQLTHGNTYWMPYRLHKKDGSFLWVMDNGYLVEDANGLHNHSIITDITVIKKQEEALRLSEKRFSVAINASSGTLFEVDLKKQLYTHFENPERIFGTSATQLLADTSAFASLSHEDFVAAVTRYFFHPEDQLLTQKALATVLISTTTSYEARLRRFDGSYLWCHVDLSLSFDEFGAPASLIGFISDIDEIKKQSELLANKVQADPMTGLYNKIAIATLSNEMLKNTTHVQHALILLDIDNFKGINDTLGHAFGDLVLIEISTKLKNSFRDNDLVGRLGGDEFVIFMKNVAGVNSVLKKVTELSAAFRQTYSGEKGAYTISCSMGVVMVKDPHENFAALCRKADAALYQAKRNGKDQFVLYQEDQADSYPLQNTRTDDEELQNLKTTHSIEGQIFELLYTSKDFNLTINMALAAIGQQYHVSRVAIFENDENGLTTSNTYEWCNEGIIPGISHLQQVPLTSGSSSIFDSFDHNGLLYCNDVKELPAYFREALALHNMLSTLQVTIVNDEKVCGFIGFGECKGYRVWTAEEVEKLAFLSKVLSVFLFKKKAEVTLLENLHTRLKILDVLPDYICVINPETHLLVYANSKMQQLFPNVKPDAFCFRTLHGGNSEPCTVCLAEFIARGETDNLEILSEDHALSLKVNVLSINWINDKKMVLLYGTDENHCQL